MSGLTPSQSGRERARAHRKGQMSGKTASSVRTSSPVASSTTTTTSPARRPVAPAAAPVAVAGGREAARQKRQQLKSGKVSQGQSSTNPHPKAKARKSPVEAVAQPREERVAKTQASQPAQRQQVRPVANSAPASQSGRNAAKQKRQQLKSGKGSRVQSSTNPHPKAKRSNTAEPVVQPRDTSVAVATETTRRTSDRKVNAVNAAAPVKQSGGRNVARAWRKAGAKGKVGQSAYKSKGSQSGTLAKMANPDASTREIARKIRADRCTRGKAGCAPVETSSSKKSRQAKSRNAVPAKVGESNTLSGKKVSGTMIGQGRKALTGAETGACQLVSGTEYLGSEEFANNCKTTPSAAPAKVTQTQTTRGQVVSGSEVGRSEKVSGNEVGQCSAITGTEYIPADQGKAFCGTDVVSKTAAKAFSVMSQPSQVRSSGVTGSDSYKSQSTTIRPKNPQKVVTSMTAMGNATTGTQVGRLQDVTGNEAGVCKSVTGTGYQSAEEVKALCNTSAEPTAIKVTASGTRGGQTVTGDRSGGNFGMTGAEQGACQAVSGTSYQGVEQVEACSTEQRNSIQQRFPKGGNPSISGVQPGIQGLTGAQRGACSLVSGTNYLGMDETSVMCGTASAAQVGASDFPIMMGAAAAAKPMAPVAVVEEPQSKITGDGWDRGSKVTGTEGPWARQRNTSIRGNSMASPMSASQYRPVAMEEVPQSPITGSSGNTESGAKVTLSGGARA